MGLCRFFPFIFISVLLLLSFTSAHGFGRKLVQKVGNEGNSRLLLEGTTGMSPEDYEDPGPHNPSGVSPEDYEEPGPHNPSGVSPEDYEEPGPHNPTGMLPEDYEDPKPNTNSRSGFIPPSSAGSTPHN